MQNQGNYEQGSQERVPTRRIARSYVPQHLDLTSILLMNRVFSVLLCFLCFLSFFLFLDFIAWFLCFPSNISVFMLGPPVFPLFSLYISLNSIDNLSILLTNRVTFLLFTFFHRPTDPT